MKKSFNPRPRMGGDILYIELMSRYRVSIHAPAWGATQVASNMGTDHTVSIHAPAWGATLEEKNHFGLYQFQSTPPHGGRRFVVDSSDGDNCFNPRPRMGGD